MKAKQIKIVSILLVLIVALTAVFLVRHYRRTLSPTATVELYFEHFSNKDPKKMESLVADNLKGGVFEWEYLEYVQILSVHEDKRPDETLLEKTQENCYPEAQYVARVFVSFDIKFADNAPTRSGFENTIYTWHCILAKQAENDPWIIVSLGV